MPQARKRFWPTIVLFLLTILRIIQRGPNGFRHLDDCLSLCGAGQLGHSRILPISGHDCYLDRMDSYSCANDSLGNHPKPANDNRLKTGQRMN